MANKSIIGCLICGLFLISINLHSQNRRTTTNTTIKPKESVKPNEVKTKQTATKSKEEEEVKPQEKINTEADYSKLSMRVSLGAMPMAPSGDLTNSSGKIGTLELLYNISRRLFIGGYTTNMIHFESYDLVLVDNKVVDLNSSGYNIVGLSMGFRVLNSKVVVISPELKGGMAFYTAKSLNFPTDSKSFIDRKSMVLNPNLSVGFRLSEKFQLGINGGYQLVMSTLKGPEMDYFNPSTLNYGLSAQFEF